MKKTKNIKTIPATLKQFSSSPINENRKRRVAGYARVSTDSEEQFTSYEAQVDYYTSYIKSREDWEFVKVYTDEGISGTNTTKREGFKSMIADAMEGKFDLIVTKSVSRFARNTVDSLTTVRQLKEKGIEIYFEKENIWTLDSKGELLITIMSSLAQEESRSISENVKWGHRKRFADGKVTVPFGHFLGYDRGENGNLVINPDQAIVVKQIYSLFLQGMTPYGIAKKLTEDGILTPSKKSQWNQGTVRRILTNEKYKGDALLQKSYTVDFLTKKKKLNEGEIPQYYVENNHEAIIEPEIFDMVQIELEKRHAINKRHNGVHIFSSKIKCSECGNWYGSKVWHSNCKHRKIVWQCNHKYKGEKKCTTPHIYEDDLKILSVKAFNQLIAEKSEIIKNFKSIKNTLYDTRALEAEQAELENQIAIVTEMLQNYINENAQVALNQFEYQKKYDSLAKMYENHKLQLKNVNDQIAYKIRRRITYEALISNLKNQNSLITEFDPVLWYSMVDYITVFSKDNIQFTFKNEMSIRL